MKPITAILFFLGLCMQPGACLAELAEAKEHYVSIEAPKMNFKGSIFKKEIVKNAIQVVYAHKEYELLLNQNRVEIDRESILHLGMNIKKRGHLYDLNFILSKDKNDRVIKKVGLKSLSKNTLIYRSKQMLYRLFYGEEAKQVIPVTSEKFIDKAQLKAILNQIIITP